MKIRISNLFLAIKVFLHFDELNAVNFDNIPGGEIQGTGLKLVARPANKPTVTGTFKGLPVQLWVGQDHYVNYVYNFHCRLPLTLYWNREDFLIRHAEVAGRGLIAYESKAGELLGLVGPSQITGEHALRPGPMTWYINYWNSHKFELDVNYNTKTVWAMYLKGGNLPRYQDHQPIQDNVAGIHFKIYKDERGKIFGADMIGTFVYTN